MAYITISIWGRLAEVTYTVSAGRYLWQLRGWGHSVRCRRLQCPPPDRQGCAVFRNLWWFNNLTTDQTNDTQDNAMRDASSIHRCMKWTMLSISCTPGMGIDRMHCPGWTTTGNTIIATGRTFSGEISECYLMIKNCSACVLATVLRW